MQNKKISLFLLFSLLICSFVASFPLGSAGLTVVTSYDYSKANNFIALSNYHPTSTAEKSAFSYSFTPTSNGYLSQIMVQFEKYGSPNGVFDCIVVSQDNSTVRPRYQDVIAQSSDTYNINLFPSSSYSIATYNFNETCLLQTGHWYSFIITCISGSQISSSHFLKCASSTLNDNTGLYWGFESNNFQSQAQIEVCYYLSVETSAPPTPTPTPSPSPSPSPTPVATPISFTSDFWAFMSPYGSLILPLIIILAVAILCGKFGGVWGFFAGLNVSVILIYAIMGVNYFPLWGIILLATVDGLLLFGKISGRV